MKIYLASSWKNYAQPFVVHALRQAGHSVYDFRNPAPDNHGFAWQDVEHSPHPWSAELTREVLDRPIAQMAFDLDFNGMRWADCIVMLQPCGRSAALELGWAAGAGKRTIVLLADGQEPELMLLAADYLCLSIEEVLEILRYEPPAIVGDREMTKADR